MAQHPGATSQDAAGDMRWVHGLQRKLGVQPTGRQTWEQGFEPMGDIYRCASAEFFGTIVIVLTSGFAIISAGEALHATTDVYPYDTAAANLPPGNTLAELGPQGLLSVAVAVSSAIMVLLYQKKMLTFILHSSSFEKKNFS